MIAVTNAIEALRMANRCLGRTVYTWQVLSLDGAPVPASNGLQLTPTVPLSPPDLLFVCGGIDVRAAVSKPLLAALRRAARAGTPLGALCTGTFALAEAGLLNGYRCAVHWEDAAAISEAFPDIELVNELFVLDRDRLTCTGGIGPLDMMLHLIEARLGRHVAEYVSANFILERIRPAAERQPVHDRLIPNDPVLTKAIALIEAQLTEPEPMHKVAGELGISVRQLERLFRTHLDDSPAAFAQKLRLKRAQSLLQQTAMPATKIALACGFTSSAYFSTAYRAHFGYSPRVERHIQARPQ
jgi:transcriptional regulator GlxA family with amidase domain